MKGINSAVTNFMRGSDHGFVRLPPEPRNRLKLNFDSLLSGVGSLVGNTVALGAGGMNPEYTALINKQIEMQEQMQLVSMSSNIEKSRHESQMAAIRNIRAS